MTDPIIWERYGNYVVSDIPVSLEGKVKEFVNTNYIQKNIICRTIKVTEEENYIEDHNFFLDHIFRGQSSLVILHEQTNEIVAAAVLKPMTKEMRSWSTIPLFTKNRKVNSLWTITRKMIVEAVKNKTVPVDTMHIFEICEIEMKDENDNVIEWLPKLLHGASRVAQCMKVNVLSFVAFTVVEQDAAEKAGLQEISKIFYPTYAATDGSHPFPASGIGELYAKLYTLKMPPVVPYYKMP